MFYLIKKPWLYRKLIYGDCIWEIKKIKKTIYLTFDDGPNPEITPFVLDQLKIYNAKATFFCIGKQVSQFPDIYHKTLESGHVVGNHTYTHMDGWKSPSNQYLKDIGKAKNLIDSPLFRPPFGHVTRFGIQKIKKQLGLHTVMWSVLSGDFDPETSPTKCYENVIHHTSDGSIVVFHDSIKASRTLKYVLPKVLEYFSENGFNFESIVI